MVSNRAFRFIAAAALGLATLAGCGGGGSTPSEAGSASALTNYLVDGPVKGLSYTCSPSGLAGVTGANGGFVCNRGDTASFRLSVGSGDILFGAIAVPGSGGTSVPVTMFASGLQIAEILQALNHGTVANMDVSGLTMPGPVVAEINNYISSGGSMMAGHGSDDQFLLHVQSQTAGASFTNSVSGTGSSFQQTVVLPHLQDTIVSISATNPPPPVSASNVTKLSGSILVSGSGTIPAVAGCTTGTLSATGGGIVNAVVNGDLQIPGTYAATFSSPGFSETVAVSAITCTSNGVTTIIPANTATATVPPFDGVGSITVTQAFGGTNLSMSDPTYVPPQGCTGGGDFSGTNVGLSNPLISLSSSVSCVVEGASFSVNVTAKMVGAW